MSLRTRVEAPGCTPFRSEVHARVAAAVQGPQVVGALAGVPQALATPSLSLMAGGSGITLYLRVFLADEGVICIFYYM